MPEYTFRIFSNGLSALSRDRDVVRLNGERINSKMIDVLKNQYHVRIVKDEHYENGVLVFDYYT